jgi:hypothetical protein
MDTMQSYNAMSMCWPRPLLTQQRRADGRHAVHACVHVGNGHAKQRGRLARHADEGHRSALGLGNQAKARTVGIRPRVAIGGDGAVHQLFIAFAQLFVAQTEFSQSTRAVVFYKHVGAVSELVHQLQATRVAQVNAQAFFSHVLLHEVTALAVDHRRAGAACVAFLRALDLDDLGPHGA